MQLKIAGIVLLALLGSQISYANAVHLHANKQVVLGYHIAHKNPNEVTKLSTLKKITIDDSTTISVSLDGFKYAGIVPVSINGKPVPPEATQFAEPNQCSMATDTAHTEGVLAFIYKGHKPHKVSITCTATGGIFG